MAEAAMTESDTMSTAAALYSSADKPTRAMIDRELDSVRRRRGHRIALEYLGMVFGLVVALVFGWWSYDLILAGHGWAGGVMAVTDITGMAFIFIKGRNA